MEILKVFIVIFGALGLLIAAPYIKRSWMMFKVFWKIRKLSKTFKDGEVKDELEDIADKAKSLINKV